MKQTIITIIIGITALTAVAFLARRRAGHNLQSKIDNLQSRTGAVETSEDMRCENVGQPIQDFLSAAPAFSITDFQRFLKSRGYYKGKIDNKVGPLTIAAWDAWVADEYAGALATELDRPVSAEGLKLLDVNP